MTFITINPIDKFWTFWWIFLFANYAIFLFTFSFVWFVTHQLSFGFTFFFFTTTKHPSKLVWRLHGEVSIFSILSEKSIGELTVDFVWSTTVLKVEVTSSELSLVASFINVVCFPVFNEWWGFPMETHNLDALVCTSFLSWGLCLTKI